MPRTATVTATTDVRVLVITERDFGALMKHSAEGRPWRRRSARRAHRAGATGLADLLGGKLERAELGRVVAELLQLLDRGPAVLDRLRLADLASAWRALTMLSRRASFTGSSSSAKSSNASARQLLASWAFAGGFRPLSFVGRRGAASGSLSTCPLNVAMSIDGRAADRRRQILAPIRLRAPCWYSRLRDGLRAAAATREHDEGPRGQAKDRTGSSSRYPTEAGVRCHGGAEITPVEPDLVRTSEGSEPCRTRHSGESSRCRSACACSDSGHDAALDEPRHLAAGARPAGVLRPAAARRARGDARRRRDRERMLAVAALIGADARVPTMVLQRAPLGRRGSYLATGAQHPAVPRLGDLRADRDRDRSRSAVRQALRVQGGVALEARVRRRRGGARAARARSASSAASCASSRSGPCSRPSSTSPGGSSTARTSAASGPRAATRARSGSRSTPSSPSPCRGRRSSRTTRASRANRRSAFFGVGHRLPAADAVPVRVRLDPRAVARRRPEPSGADPRRDRRRRRRGGARAARA